MKQLILKNKNWIFPVLVILINVVVLGVLFWGGKLENRSGMRIGYFGTATNTEWTGKYVVLDGHMSKVLKPEGDELKVEIVTEDGSIDIYVEDENGEKLYKGSDMQTCSFTVGVSGKVKIKIDADNHKGSFSFDCHK